MNSKTFHKIVQLNKDFYERVGDKFSKTRQSPWQGWQKVVEAISKNFKNEVSVLDLGCGNGRFYEYLKTELKDIKINYTGVDFSNKLLNMAIIKLEGENVKFIKQDVISSFPQSYKHYDVIVAFGLTHHIPSEEYREKWFKEILKLVKKDGLFIYTIWDFTKDNRFKNSTNLIATDKVTISQSELESGDYFLGWQNMKHVYRYFHKYSEAELASIASTLKDSDMELTLEYTADGKSQDLNHYFIWRKFS